MTLLENSEVLQQKIQKNKDEISFLQNHNPYFRYLCQIHINFQCNIPRSVPCRSYCYTRTDINKNMDLNTFLGILQKHTPRQIALGGGEPLLHPQFSEMISIASQQKFLKHVNFTTNGWQIPESLNSIANTVGGIAISIDNLRYPKLFSHGLPSTVEKNLKQYQQHEILLACNFVISPNHLEVLDILIQFLLKNHFKIVYLLGLKSPNINWINKRTNSEKEILRFINRAKDYGIFVGLDCCLMTLFSGQKCVAGKRFIIYDPMGNSSNCAFMSLCNNKCPFGVNLFEYSTNISIESENLPNYQMTKNM